MRQFANNGGQGYVLGTIENAGNQYSIQECDISICLKSKFKVSDTVAASDITSNDFYAVTYLLFKHGTLAYRRQKQVVLLYIQRTIMIFTIQLIYYFANGFSETLPF